MDDFQKTPSEEAARHELREAVRTTLATESAKVRYTMQANPSDLADYDFGEGIVDFRERRSRIAYTGNRRNGTSDCPQLVEQITDRHLTYLRVGGPGAEWIELELGTPEEIGASGDAGGFLELLEAPGTVLCVATDERFDGQPAQRYTLRIDAPRSSLRERLKSALGARGPSRFWLEAIVDTEARVRRISACDHAPKQDGTLPRGAVCTTVEFSEFGIPAPVVVPPTA